MFVVIFRHDGERFEMVFTQNEKALANAIANKYAVKVYQPGALISC